MGYYWLCREAFLSLQPWQHGTGCILQLLGAKWLPVLNSMCFLCVLSVGQVLCSSTELTCLPEHLQTGAAGGVSLIQLCSLSHNYPFKL